MINEVINETEEAKKNDESVPQETNTENSADAPAEEISASNEEPKTSDEPTATEESTASEEPKAVEEPKVADEFTVAEEQDSEESPSMAEMDFGAILEEFEQDQEVYHTGKLVEGTVVDISDRGVLIDFGYKSEGVVPSDEFTSMDGELTVKAGDTVEVIIKNIYSGDAPPVLSYLDAIRRKSWDEIETAFNEERPIKVLVVSKTKGGLKIDINGVEAFLPGSQVDSRPIRNLDSFRGKEIEAKIIKFSRKRNNIVLSRKVLTDEVVNKQKAETLEKIEQGYVVEGVVKNLTEYGAFVDLGGIDGLLHVTDMSWGRLQNPNEMFKVNDQIQVKILKLDREKEKVSLGYKQLLPDPWSTVVEVYPVDSTIKGIVSSVTDYGAFVELEAGVEGLVHISEMSWSKRTKSPKKLVRPGEEVEVQVLGIDTEERRISLGMKQLQDNPWDTIGERYHIGSKVIGKVRNLTDFGAFIEIEDGVDGLVHVSDISHSKKIKHPKDVLKKDQEVEAVVTNIDTQGHRLSLSIKELTPSTWDAFVQSHKPGDVVKGKVSRFAGFGVFVELGNELEGLCHISELSDERVEKPEDVVSIGQELDFKILRIENDVQKIGLSHRAVGKEDEPVVDTKNYSTEAKGGMASLGELMNLKRTNQDEVEEEIADEPKLSKKERRAQRAKEQAQAGEETDNEEVSVETETSETTEEPAKETTTAEESPAKETTETVEATETTEISESTDIEEAKTEETAEISESTDIEEAKTEETSEAVEETTEVEASKENVEAATETAEPEATEEVKAEENSTEEVKEEVTSTEEVKEEVTSTEEAKEENTDSEEKSA
jgi:small subunit ribosomal protein S1